MSKLSPFKIAFRTESAKDDLSAIVDNAYNAGYREAAKFSDITSGGRPGRKDRQGGLRKYRKSLGLKAK